MTNDKQISNYFDFKSDFIGSLNGFIHSIETKISFIKKQGKDENEIYNSIRSDINVLKYLIVYYSKCGRSNEHGEIIIESNNPHDPYVNRRGPSKDYRFNRLTGIFKRIENCLLSDKCDDDTANFVSDDWLKERGF